MFCILEERVEASSAAAQRDDMGVIEVSLDAETP
jgi:hypothetical protein